MSTQALRVGDVTYSDLILASGCSGPYPAGTPLVTVTYDDGDRFCTVAPSAVVRALVAS